jgi:hypothetical protein
MTVCIDMLASRDDPVLTKHPCDAIVFALRRIVQRQTARHGKNAGRLADRSN